MPGTARFIYWQEDNGNWLGHLEEFPDYWTQGETLDELKVNLADIHADVTGSHIPGVRRVNVALG